MDEEWRPIDAVDGAYEVSTHGRIRRLRKARGTRPGRFLKTTPHNAGYLQAALWARNQQHTFLVHQLVAAAFIGPVPYGYEINHKDGDKHNNIATNLEYITRPDNIQHAIGLGLFNTKGVNNPQAKLTPALVAEIRSLYNPGGNPGYKALAKRYGVTWEAIRQIVKLRTWT